MGKLEDYRREIDAIDDKIAALYAARMAVCRKIGEEKAKDCASVAVPGREKQIVNRVTADMPDEIKISQNRSLRRCSIRARPIRARLSRVRPRSSAPSRRR